MTEFKKIILVLTALAASQGAFCQTDLERCIQLAYENYPQIEEYNLIEESKKYDLDNAAMAWLPQLSLSGKASWQSVVVEMPFEIQGYEFNIPHDQYGVSADISQQIWDGGASAVQRKLIEAGADVKSRQLEVNLYSIRSRVQNIYLGIILIDKQLELNDLLRANLVRSLDEVAALVGNGVAYESDKDQIRVNVLSCDQQRSALESDRRAYVKMLSMLTGTELQDNEFIDPDSSLSSVSYGEIARPEIALYDAQAKQLQIQKKQLSTALSPRLNLNVQAGYGRPGLNMLNGKFDSYLTAGLKLQWNFGALYTIHNDRSKSDAEAARVDLARKSFILNTSLEAEQKRNEIEKALDVLERDGEIVKLRQSIRETAEYQYKQGIIKMNDYLNILDDEFEARLNYNIHNVQYTMAVLDLQNTVGTENIR